jgi:hypothetical protein
MILGELIKCVYQEVPSASKESIEWADTLLLFKCVSEHIIAILTELLGVLKRRDPINAIGVQESETYFEVGQGSFRGQFFALQSSNYIFVHRL